MIERGHIPALPQRRAKKLDETAQGRQFLALTDAGVTDWLAQAATRGIIQESDGTLSNPTVGADILAAAQARAPAKEQSAEFDALPQIVDAHSFISTRIDPPSVLVAGLLHQGSKIVVGGGSKSFKTWTLADLGLSVASGDKWLGQNTIKGRVLFLNFEIQPAFFQQRIKAIEHAKGIKLVPGQLDVWNLRGKAAGYSELFPRIIERINRCGYVLIVLDPIYKCYGEADENSASAIAGLMNAIEELSVSTGAAVAFAAHYSKGNQAKKESIDRISGSGVFARDPDSILSFTPHTEQGAFSVEATLRNFPPLEPFVVRWEFPLMHRDDELNPHDLKQSNTGRKKNHDPLKLLAAIAETTTQNPISVSEWSARCKVERTTFHEYIREMHSKGWLATVGQGKQTRRYITPKGCKALEEQRQ